MYDRDGNTWRAIKPLHVGSTKRKLSDAVFAVGADGVVRKLAAPKSYVFPGREFSRFVA